MADPIRAASIPEPTPARGSEPLLVVDSVTKRFPNGTVALQDVSMTARPGELTVVLGHNGSGKSTLVRCVVRLVDPTAGSIRIAGQELVSLSGARLRRARRGIAVIFQDASLVPRRSALANVATGCLGRARGVRTALGGFPAQELALARTRLERVGLAALAGQRSDTLSGGQAQRVAVARALHQEPKVLLADEPVSSLDPDAAADIMQLLHDLAATERIAVVCVLHQLDLARRFADRIVGLRSGRVALDAPTSQVGLEELAALYRGEA
ncbi:MAG TPA: ATP-binding cassette domain-containing protein [Candidatus Dormibacteraeota bacterium]|nr:ATP-binding cassette domain-containing protein [Candidatus Dormibacteraeota bacterium]